MRTEQRESRRRCDRGEKRGEKRTNVPSSRLLPVDTAMFATDRTHYTSSSIEDRKQERGTKRLTKE